MRSIGFVLHLILLFLASSIAAQSPFDALLSFDEIDSTFSISLINTSQRPQVVGKGGPRADINNIQLILVTAYQDSIMIWPEISNSTRGHRALPPGGEETFILSFDRSIIPTSGEYGIQAIYKSIFQAHRNIPERSALRKAYTLDVCSNTLIFN